ncbi:MAG: hypothetical protein HQM08_22610 [Candidatus Riflebacteria bacterium]|nr:hypothetical protein [Candidatus Riflebacteria bacterium]
MICSRTRVVGILAMVILALCTVITPQVSAGKDALGFGVFVSKEMKFDSPEKSALNPFWRAFAQYSLFTASKSGKQKKLFVEIPDSLKATLTSDLEKYFDNLENDLQKIIQDNQNPTRLYLDFMNRLNTMEDECRKICDSDVKNWLKTAKGVIKTEIEKAESSTFAAETNSLNKSEESPLQYKDNFIETSKGLMVDKKIAVRSLKLVLRFVFELDSKMPSNLKSTVKKDFSSKLNQIETDLNKICQTFKTKWDNDGWFLLSEFEDAIMHRLEDLGDECQQICDSDYNSWLKNNKKNPEYKNVSTSKKTVSAFVSDPGFITGLIPPKPGAKANSDLARQKTDQIKATVLSTFYRQLVLAWNKNPEF